jgi:hypothetical protein
MPRYPDDEMLVREVQQEVARRLRLLTRRDWKVDDVTTEKQDRHVTVLGDQTRTILLSGSSIRRLLVKKFYRAHKKVDPILFSREGLITSAVTKAIQAAFNLRAASPGATWKIRCPECQHECALDAHVCIVKQCLGCTSWFARDAFTRA